MDLGKAAGTRCVLSSYESLRNDRRGVGKGGGESPSGGASRALSDRGNLGHDRGGRLGGRG